MKKHTYERMRLTITEFDSKDIIVTSGEDPGAGGGGIPQFVPDTYEMPVGM